MSAARGKFAGDVAHGGIGSGDLQLDDGLKNRRLGIGQRVKQSLSACGNECHFLAIHGMRLAVINDHADVFDRIAGDKAGLQHFTHALFHCRDEVVRNRTALHLIDEFEACSARKRFNLQVDLAELSGAARLLLVAGMAFCIG